MFEHFIVDVIKAICFFVLKSTYSLAKFMAGKWFGIIALVRLGRLNIVLDE